MSTLDKADKSGATSTPGTPAGLLCYSAFALPLSLAALPVYVYAPALYAEREHLSLAVLGAGLLGARLFDALIDPFIGKWVDRTRTSRGGYARHIVLALAPLALGFLMLFNPPAWQPYAALYWLLWALFLVHIGYSLAGIAYQSWGAALGSGRAQRSLVTGSREACGLLGVLAAAVLPGVAGYGGLCLAFVLALALGAVMLLAGAVRPEGMSGHRHADELAGITELLLPLEQPAFRKLLAVFVCNGIAAAIPATLFSFFAHDRLGLGGTAAGYYLAAYFIAGAASMPLWIALARRFGEARAWFASMLLALAAFCGAYTLGPGDTHAFALICLASGLALGADLALPPALLNAVIAQAGHGGQREGAYFGIWNWATKMNLALAAGAALPLLSWLGYSPGAASASSEAGQHALAVAYALLPCGFKAAATLLLMRSNFDDT